MSVRFDTNGSDVLFATTNFVTSTVNYSACWWQQVIVNVAGIVRPLWYMDDAGPTHGHHYYWDNTNALTFAEDSGTLGAFTTPPTITNWVFMAVTSAAAAAHSIQVYYRDNAAGALTVLSPDLTGIALFSPTQEAIGQVASSGAVTADFYNYIIFNGVLTPAQVLAQSKQFAPITGSGLTVQRWIQMVNAATAGTDSSGSSHNMTISGTLTDGASNPTFPSASNLLAASSNNGGL